MYVDNIYFNLWRPLDCVKFMYICMVYHIIYCFLQLTWRKKGKRKDFNDSNPTKLTQSLKSISSLVFHSNCNVKKVKIFLNLLIIINMDQKHFLICEVSSSHIMMVYKQCYLKIVAVHGWCIAWSAHVQCKYGAGGIMFNILT